MTGEGSRNHSSEEQQQHFTYDDPNTPPEQEYDPDYVPEREFVLMPLFRRMGEMLGIRRNREDVDHIYAPGSAALEPHVIDLNQLKVPDSQVEEDEHAISAAMQAEAEAPAAREFDLLGIEQEVEPQQTISEQLETVMAAAEIREPELEPAMTVPEVQSEPQPVSLHHEQIEPEPAVAHIAEESVAAPIVASYEEKTAPAVEVIAAREKRPYPAPARPVLTQEDIAQMIAPITEAAREAAAKISAAMSQAAEWLHTKEEEIRRRSEQAAESKRASAQASAASAPKWESEQAPAFEREAAWVETGGIPVTRAQEARPMERRPVVLKPKPPALWKRLDWAQEFTPKRVAVLGGVAMAMLMVVGVSLARRPASSVLPQQQQETHVIQPGGVTLTTHPRTTPVPTPATTQASPTNPAPRRQPAAPVRSARRAASNDGPDVVTHYYHKQKPSPAHQSTTVAAVKHYSDM